MVVTGATAGIGFETARALAGYGARVLGVGHSAPRCQEARQRILAEHPTAQVHYLTADLSSQRQVRRLAADIRQRLLADASGKLDVLINNAGTVTSWYTVSEDGYELQFAVNHLAPFLLTHELLPSLGAAQASRVITVSSGSHYGARIHWPDVMYRKGYRSLQAYKQSKLANVLFTAELNRRIGRDSRPRAYAADPGLVRTEIGFKGTGALEHWVWGLRRAQGVAPEQGASSVIFLACDPSIAGAQEIYWKNCRPKQESREARRPETALRLWQHSERLCGINWGASP
jgi:NAD(P)-dependent dehydrogenase (short-subunit alcohol dehydrogenase family)